MRRVIAPIILIGCILSPNIQAQHSTTHTKEHSIHIAPGNIKFLEQIIPWGYTPHDTLPEYPGGIGELQKFIYQNTRLPKEAEAIEFGNRVVVKFTVSKKGKIIRSCLNLCP